MHVGIDAHPSRRKQTNQFRAQVIEHFHVVESSNLAGVRILRAQLRPGPLLLGWIVVGKKQNFGVGVLWIDDPAVLPVGLEVAGMMSSAAPGSLQPER